MIINFLGDSITEGAGASAPERVYSAICAKLSKAKEGNYGVSSTRIARQRVEVNNNIPEDFILRARWMQPSDFLFVFGGTNDYGHGDAALGEFGDRTSYTFYGAMTLLIEYLLEVKKYQKEQICFILPTPRYNEDNVHGDGCKNWRKFPTLERYREAMIEVCSHFQVPYLRLTSLPLPTTNKPSEYFVDGLHPNDKGHEAIGKELHLYLKNKGLVK